MTSDNISSLFAPDPSRPAGAVLGQGIVQSWDGDTGENTIQFAGGTLANIPSLTSEAVNLVAGDVVALLVSGDRMLLVGKVTTPGDPGTVPSWPVDISALQVDVVTAQTTATTAQTAAGTAQTTADTAQTTADAAQADAATALSKFPITSTDITDGAISTPKLSANAIDGMTITGALLRTAASGQRVEIDSTTINKVRLYSGHAGETSPGYISAGASFVEIEAPNISGFGPGNIFLGGDFGFGGESQAEITADQIELTAGTWARVNGAKIMVEGGNPQPVFVSDAPSLAASLSTTYAAGTPALGTAFTAPATGKVYITVGGRIRLDSNSNTMYLGYEVRAGATVGSGTVVQAADNGRAIAIGGNATGLTFVFGGSSRRLLLTGLTPGSSYNVRTMHACQTAGTVNGTLLNRDLLIEPVL